MRIKLLLIPACLLIMTGVLPARAQTAADTAAFISADWHIREIMPGITSAHAELELFGAPQHIVYFKIDTSKYNLKVKSTDLLRVKTSKLAKLDGAAAAINGGYFVKFTGKPIHLLKEKGRIKGKPDKYLPSPGAITVDKDNNIAFIQNSGGELEKNELLSFNSPYRDIMSGPYMMIKDSNPVIFSDKQIHPRSAVGTDGKHLIMLVADGRHPEHALGITMDQNRWIMQMLGCTDALGLDGGGSSTLWNRKEGVVNYPSDNKKYDHKGERAVGNALLVIPRKRK